MFFLHIEFMFNPCRLDQKSWWVWCDPWADVWSKSKGVWICFTFELCSGFDRDLILKMRPSSSWFSRPVLQWLHLQWSRTLLCFWRRPLSCRTSQIFHLLAFSTLSGFPPEGSSTLWRHFNMSSWTWAVMAEEQTPTLTLCNALGCVDDLFLFFWTMFDQFGLKLCLNQCYVLLLEQRCRHSEWILVLMLVVVLQFICH